MTLQGISVDVGVDVARLEAKRSVQSTLFVVSDKRNTREKLQG